MSTGLLALVFVGSAAAVWLAGIQLSKTTDVLSSRLGLGAALGGLIMLAIATDLPEVAITVSAAISGHLGIAVGNLLGGVAAQTAVLALIDVLHGRDGPPLTYRAAQLLLVLEAALVIAVLVVAIMAAQLPAHVSISGIGPGEIVIAALWVLGLWLVGKARDGLPWHGDGRAPEAQAEPQGHSKHKLAASAPSTARTALVFAAAALVTLAGGVALEESGSQLAGHIGMSGVLFGGTVLAASTALPELSTGLAAVKLGDDALAMSDIFGGNAFLPPLFLLASAIAGKAVLPSAQASDVYLAGLGILLTVVYVYGLLFRPRRRVLGMGLDSLACLVLYAVGIAGLVALAAG